MPNSKASIWKIAAVVVAIIYIVKAAREPNSLKPTPGN